MARGSLVALAALGLLGMGCRVGFEMEACGSDAECADADPCTLDLCGDDGCRHVPVPGCQGCLDSFDCAGAGEICEDAVCTRQSCAGDGECPAGHGCAAGLCRPEDCEGVECASGEVCVDDACVEVGCVGVVCPSWLVCRSGNCVPRPCTRDDECDDQNVCTEDYCIAGACTPSFSDDQSCDDGMYCNGSDSCSGGACSLHAGDPCPGADGDADCRERCDETADDCTAADPDGAACADDGVFCNGTEGCQAGQCASAGDPCAPAYCNESLDACEVWYDLGGSDFGSWQQPSGGSSWGGGISATSGFSEDPSLALDATGNPVVAWVDDTAWNYEIYIRRFDGSAWVEVGAGSAQDGGISANAGVSGSPSLAVDGGGTPVVAWSDDTAGNLEIYVKRFDGSGWVEIGVGSATGGGISTTAGWSYEPTIGLDSAGNPVVAWSDDTSGNREIYARRFDGGNWLEVGAGSAQAGGISATTGRSGGPALVLDAAGFPVVAWYDDTPGNDEIYLRRFDGTGWREVGTGSASAGGISANAGGSLLPSLALDGAGNPVVAWSDLSAGMSEIYLKRFDGTAWVEVGAGSAAGGGVSATAETSGGCCLALDGAGNPLVAWHDTTPGNAEIFAKRFNGGAWEEIGPGSASSGGVSANAGWSQDPALAIDGAGRPVVAWDDLTSTNVEVYVKRFDGGAWTGVGGGGVAGGGLSATPGISAVPALAMDASGRPVVAWFDDTAGNQEIYLKRFDGTAWVELVGSASVGGVSANASASWLPALALDGADQPVLAWTDWGSGNSDIYLKRFNGAWVEVGAGSATGGGIHASAGSSQAPAIALDAAGRPVVAWEDDTSGNFEIYIMRFDGAGWVEVGAGSATGAGISGNAGWSGYTSLVLDDAGDPMVAWYDDSSGNMEIYIKRFSGGSWIEVGAGSASGGGISANGGWSGSPALVLDGAGNPVLAWSDFSPGGADIYVKRFDGNTWMEVGPGSASGGGISSNPGWSQYPALATDGTGQMVVAWQDETSGNSEVYVKRFDGTVWSEIGIGSASGGGVSNSSASSYLPVVASGGGRICVAWEDCGATSQEILLRCTNE